MGLTPLDRRYLPGVRAARAMSLALVIVAVATSAACAAAGAGRSQDSQIGVDRTAGEASTVVAAGAPDAVTEDEKDSERTIAERRFVRRGEDWYLESEGRRFRVLPHSLSIRFREAATADERRDFLTSRGFEVIRENRLGILDVRTGPDRHAVDWLAELTGHELLALIEVHTEGTYEEE